MRSKISSWALCLTAVLASAAGIGALAQDKSSAHFSGVIHDYTPISTTAAWEVRGPWSLRLNEEAPTADFSASLTMEESVLGQSPANVGTAALAQHTHHITMKGATVTFDPTDCPAHAAGTPAYTARLEVRGPAIVTGNGGPFPPPPAIAEPSELQVCIDGGTVVAYSNITLAFGTPASGHFGSQPIHGVVRKTSGRAND